MGELDGRPARSWARQDRRRLTIATLGATFLTAPLVTLWIALERLSVVQYIVLSCIIAWTLLSAVNAGLAWYGFRGLSGDDLAAALGLEQDGAGAWVCPKRLLERIDVPISALALAVVAMLAFTAGTGDRPALVSAGLIMVAVSWVNVALSSAIIYPRLDLSEGGLDFPGGGRPTWSRYLYFAFTIQSAFATPDVEVRTDRMRSAVLTQTLLAFVFNTVILAVIVAMLLSVTLSS
ncbi:MAG: DUF1345 domain-containing protein [Actinomycetia bacterium]|nr:DUF1345 domain-containing protein [Actinomycetes bacterium]